MIDINKDFRLFAHDRNVPTTTLDDYQRVTNSYINPSIIEERKMNVASMDVFSRLFMERILFLGTDINSDVANIVNSQLLYLQMENPTKPVTMYINSPGGSVCDGMSIYDVCKFISCPIATTCCGLAASMGAVLLSSGDKGMRNALPHSKIMLHSVSSGTGRATAQDIEIFAEEVKKTNNLVYSVLAENMGKTIDYVAKICDRDHWLTSEEAVKEGVIDSVIVRH